MFFFFKPKTAYAMRISDWSSDVCSSDLVLTGKEPHTPPCLWLHDGHAANTAFHHHVGNQGAWRFGISGRQGCIRNMFGKGGVRKCAFDPPPQCISAGDEADQASLLINHGIAPVNGRFSKELRGLCNGH